MSQNILKIENEDYILGKRVDKGLFMSIYEGEKITSSEKCLIKVVEYSNEILSQIKIQLKKVKGCQIYLPKSFLRILNFEIDDVSKQLFIAQEFCGMEKITQKKGQILEIFLINIIREIIKIYSTEDVRVFSEIVDVAPLNNDQIYYDSESCDLKIDVVNFFVTQKRNFSLFKTKENIKNLGFLCYDLLGCREQEVQITKTFRNFIFFLLFSEKLEWNKLNDHFLISQLQNEKVFRPTKNVEKMKNLMLNSPESLKSAVKSEIIEITSGNSAISDSLKDFLFQLYSEEVLRIENIFKNFSLNEPKLKKGQLESRSIFQSKLKIQKSLEFLSELNNRRRDSLNNESNFFKIFLFTSGRCLLYHDWLNESLIEVIKRLKLKNEKFIKILDASSEVDKDQKNLFVELFNKKIKEKKNEKKILKKTINELTQFLESIKKGEFKDFYDLKDLDVKMLEEWFKMGLQEVLEKQQRKLLEQELRTFIDN